jgi:hypothetical protein
MTVRRRTGSFFGLPCYLSLTVLIQGLSLHLLFPSFPFSLPLFLSFPLLSGSFYLFRSLAALFCSFFPALSFPRFLSRAFFPALSFPRFLSRAFFPALSFPRFLSLSFPRFLSRALFPALSFPFFPALSFPRFISRAFFPALSFPSHSYLAYRKTPVVWDEWFAEAKGSYLGWEAIIEVWRGTYDLHEATEQGFEGVVREKEKRVNPKL